MLIPYPFSHCGALRLHAAIASASSNLLIRAPHPSQATPYNVRPWLLGLCIVISTHPQNGHGLSFCVFSVISAFPPSIFSFCGRYKLPPNILCFLCHHCTLTKLYGRLHLMQVTSPIIRARLPHPKHINLHITPPVVVASSGLHCRLCD